MERVKKRVALHLRRLARIIMAIIGKFFIEGITMWGEINTQLVEICIAIGIGRFKLFFSLKP